ncbi:glycosyltransferase [Kerstersia gyiorum]|uniref:glycosyltransferase n=1 Tax=Kerstersia gyiorum TaxID=206506 RepID=UPI00214FB5A4|nr:glycosyltransferase [Kerstersia gyiorum]MCR4158985.1 glycosyltransferase [Kerstersia gyiorum]
MKVLHVLASLDVGGVEKWLSDLVLYNSQKNKRMDIYIAITSDFKSNGDFFEKNIIGAGAKVFRLQNPKKNIFLYLYGLFKLIKSEKIDVVHSHLYLFSGLVLLVAKLAGTKVRVVHSHSSLVSGNRIKVKFLRLLTSKFSTCKLAVSNAAGNSLYGKNEQYVLLPCGISFERLNVSTDKEFGFLQQDIDEKRINLFHVGRFVKSKNHKFLVELAKALIDRGIQNKYRFVFIGGGPEKEEIENDFSGIEIVTVFLPENNFIKELMFQHADVFLFPSLREGLGIVALEAQSQGVTTLLSTHVPNDVMVTDYCYKLPVESESSISDWLDLIQCFDIPVLRSEKKSRSCLTRQNLDKTNFSISFCYENLIKCYLMEMKNKTNEMGL